MRRMRRGGLGAAIESIGDTKWNAMVASQRTEADERDATMDRLVRRAPSATKLIRAFDDAWAAEVAAREEAAFKLGRAARP